MQNIQHYVHSSCYSRLWNNCLSTDTRQIPSSINVFTFLIFLPVFRRVHLCFSFWFQADVMLRYTEFVNQGDKSKKKRKKSSELICFGWVVVPLSAAGALQTIGSPKKTKLITKIKCQILLSLEGEKPAFIRILNETASSHTDNKCVQKVYIWHTDRFHVLL